MFRNVFQKYGSSMEIILLGSDRVCHFHIILLVGLLLDSDINQSRILIKVSCICVIKDALYIIPGCNIVSPSVTFRYIEGQLFSAVCCGLLVLI